MKVASNAPGKAIFLALALVVLVYTALLGVCISLVAMEHRWLPVIAAVLASLAFFLLVLITFSAKIYALRFVNVTFLVIMSLALGVVAVMSYQQIQKTPFFLLTVTSLLAVYLAGLAVILAPDAHSDLAHRMHPFVAEAELGDITLSGRHHRHGRKRIKHREVSVFEDWPTPVPFTAQALYSYQTSSSSELPFEKGDQLVILDCRGNWWQAKNPQSGTTGFVPSNYIQVQQKARVRRTHEAKSEDEATVLEGQMIEVMEIHEFMCLVRTVDGRIGSVPTECLEIDPTSLPNYDPLANHHH